MAVSGQPHRLSQSSRHHDFALHHLSSQSPVKGYLLAKHGQGPEGRGIIDVLRWSASWGRKQIGA